ncbi:DUF6161 domain-containing protein [Rhizobium tropici]|uniref:DUF6161 domain-containing protein n=1 Tax=Rhizobium tropici TaxID=398 RepID=A0A329YGB8_RHITR|nr:DUF6161 domain-containing protein [Rhizobium tropici]RAX42416.1 hypothetical protein DQ393_06125 [Rhizobium tropici]
MDRATYNFLQTIFQADPLDTPDSSPEAEKDTWVQLMAGEINAFRQEGPYGPIIPVLETMMRDFEYRTLAPTMAAAFEMIRPIDQRKVAAFLTQLRDMQKTPDMLCAIAAQWMFEFRYLFAMHMPMRPQNQTLKIDPSIEMAIGAEIASYASWRNLEVEHEEGQDRLSDLAGKFAVQFNEQLLNAEKTINRFNENIIQLQERDAELRQRNEDFDKTYAQQTKNIEAADMLLSALEKRVSNTEANYTTFSAAIERKYAISATRDYWSKQAKKTGEAFWYSVFILAVLLVAVPIALISRHTEVLGALQDVLITPIDNLKPDATLAQISLASINRLILIILPVALLIWFVRLLVRFATRSLALMDDAQLRQAMMDTFLRLDVDSNLSQDERNVMLNALYRPGPGQSPDVPDFPNVIELINKIGPR